MRPTSIGYQFGRTIVTQLSRGIRKGMADVKPITSPVYMKCMNPTMAGIRAGMSDTHRILI